MKKEERRMNNECEEMMPDLWYQDGLRFQCTRCGNCCTGAPGFVWTSDDEVGAIAEFLGEPAGQVEAMYTHSVDRRRSLREKSNGDCVFFDREKGCTIYAVRPRQCRTWPFWESNVRSPEAWEKTRYRCPGSGQGELISAEEITRRIQVIRL
jgi:Fe-S-cluster containining protein